MSDLRRSPRPEPSHLCLWGSHFALAIRALYVELANCASQLAVQLVMALTSRPAGLSPRLRDVVIRERVRAGRGGDGAEEQRHARSGRKWRGVKKQEGEDGAT